MEKESLNLDNPVSNTDYKEVVYKPTTKSGPLKSSKGSTVFLYTSVAIVNLLTLALGAAFSWTSPVLPKLNFTDPNINPLPSPITSMEGGWIAGILPLGAAFGPFIAGALADKIGKKYTLLVASLPLTTAYIVLGFATHVYVFYMARFTQGVAVGGTFAVLPMYLGEIAEDSNRGIVGCLLGVFVAAGLLYSYVIGPFLSIRMFSFVCAFPAIVFFPLFYALVPESPVYLAVSGNRKAAQEALMKLRTKGAEDVQDELAQITKAAEEAASNRGGFRDLFASRGVRKACTICVGLMMLQQGCGINVVTSYMQEIFKAAGGDLSFVTATILIAVIQLAVSCAVPAVVDRLGRKLLILISTSGSGVSLVALGAFFHFKNNGYHVESISWLPVASLIAFIVLFNVGLGSIPWAVAAEMFPAEVKSAAATLISASAAVTCFAVTFVFPLLSESLGMAMSFWLFAVICGFGVVFVYLMMLETKGRTLAQIQDLLDK